MNPKITFVGEAWGAGEERAQRPLTWVSGMELYKELIDAKLLTEAPGDVDNVRDFWWFWRQYETFGRDEKFIEPRPMCRIWDAHPEIYLTNVFNLRPKNNEIEDLCGPRVEGVPGWPAIRPGKYIRAEFYKELERLRDELLRVSPNLIVCLGGTATWALLHNPGITKLRGAITEAAPPFHGKVLPVYHPAAVLRQWEWRPVTVLDYSKAKREARFPEVRRPARRIYIAEDIDDLYKIQKLSSLGPLSIDIETAADQITCIAFAFVENSVFVIPFVDNRQEEGSYWSTLAEERVAWDTVRHLCTSPVPKIFQNGLYDMHFLWRSYGIPVRGIVEDTMLMHHALQPESPKGLGFLGSVYTNEASWKLMRTRGKTTIKKDE